MADVPDTDDVRDIWVDYHLNPLPRAEGIALVPEYQAAFDVWLGTIRADERARFLDSLHTQQELVDDDQRWAVLRAKVEALRGKWQRSVDRDPDGKLSGYDRAHVAALGDVLELIDGGSDG